VNLNFGYILLDGKSIKFLKGEFQYRRLMKLDKTQTCNVFYRLTKEFYGCTY